MSRPKKIIHQEEFKVDGTFQSMYAAERWLREHGYGWGSGSGSGKPTAIMKGDYYDYNLPHKWKNFSDYQIQRVHGKMTGDFRNGPISVVIYDNHPEKVISPRTILHFVCEKYETTQEELSDPTHEHQYAKIRHVYLYLLKRFSANLSSDLKKGAHLVNRHHSVIYNSFKWAEDKRDTDPEFNKLMRQYEQELEKKLK